MSAEDSKQQQQQRAAPGLKPAPQLKRGVVKSCLSGDCVVIRGKPRGGPPPEVTLALSGVAAPRLARRPANPGAGSDAGAASPDDEPFAWEAREFLRKKLVGKEALFAEETTTTGSGRSYGNVYLPPEPNAEDLSLCEDVRKSLLLAGLATVRESRHPDVEALRRFDEEARVAKVGLHGDDSSPKSQRVRRIDWRVAEPRKLTESLKRKPVKAVVEFVVNSTTLRAFLLPVVGEESAFRHVTILLSGVRTPAARAGEDDPAKAALEAEAKFFVESRLLQRDVEVVLEGVSNNNFIGSVLHPNGNVAELLLQEGLAQCVDWSMSMVTGGADKYRLAEKEAKAQNVRMWKDWVPSAGPAIDESERAFSGSVAEIVNADTLVLKLPNGDEKKVALASVRPPRQEATAAAAKPGPASAATPKAASSANPPQIFRPLYDVPYAWEAREFLRKKLVGKKVNVVVDYVQPASGDSLPERLCCTVTIGGINVAEALASKGFCTVVRYRQDDDRRSSAYDALMAAESRAQKKGLGVHAKNPPPPCKISDVSSGDLVKAKQFLPSLRRAGRLAALVEFVAAGSRLRVFVPRETCLVTLLLAGVTCPRGRRLSPETKDVVLPAEPFGDEARRFVKDACLQREVEIEVESTDKGGNFIGHLFLLDGANVSEMLVEEGLAKVHFTAEKGDYCAKLKAAEATAKGRRSKLWAEYVEEEEEAAAAREEKEAGREEEEAEEEEEKAEATDDKMTTTTTTTTTTTKKSVDRFAAYKAVVVTELRKEDLHVFCQFVDDGPKLEELMEELNRDLEENPPLAGSLAGSLAGGVKKGDAVAAKFPEDGRWYRAKVTSVDGAGRRATVFYADYGNESTVSTTNELAPLPAGFSSSSSSSPPAPFAREFGLALTALPENDDEAKEDAFAALAREITSAPRILLNAEYVDAGVNMATLWTSEDEEDVVERLIAEGFLLHDKSKMRERKLASLNRRYGKAQESAQAGRFNLWRYGDFIGEDAKEFGVGGRR